MATAYTDLLRLALPVQGELEGSWGDAVNAQITSMIEQAIAGRVSIALTSTSDVTLGTSDGATDQSRPAILNFTGTPGGAVNIICPTKSKTYVVSNNTNQTITVKTSGGTGQAITAGTSALVSCDGTNVIASAATTAQGVKADNALPTTGGAMTGPITTNSTFDGVDVAARDAVLTTTTTTADNALPEADVDADIKTLVLPASTTISSFGKDLVGDADAGVARGTLGLGSSATTASSAYATAAQGTKADNALPEADVDANIKTLVLPASTTISSFGKSLVDDADAGAARTTLGLGSSATTASSAYATAAQGTKADNALPKAGGTLSGNLTVNATTDTDNLKINSAQGSDGQVLTSTGSGVNWEDVPAGTAYTAGSGIAVNSFVISNTAPDQTVTLTDGTGITTSGTYPDFTITNSSPDRTVSLTGTGGTTVTGTYPNFTVDSSSTTYTAGTGLSLSAGNVFANTAPDQTVILSASTGIGIGGTYPSFTITNSQPDLTVSLTGGTGITTSGTYPNFTITNSAPGGETLAQTLAVGSTTGGNDLTVSTGDAILSPANSNLVIQGAGTTDNYVQFGAGGEFEIAVTGTGAGSRVDLSERNVGVSPLAINGRDIELNTALESGTVGQGLIVLSGSTSTSIRISSTDTGLTAEGITAFNANGAGNEGTDWCWMQTGNANKANAPVSAASESGGVITITLARPLSGNNVPTAGDECALGQEVLNRMLRNNSTSGGIRLYGGSIEAIGSTVNDYNAQISGGGLLLSGTSSNVNIGITNNTQAIAFTQVNQTDATSSIAMNVREVVVKGTSSAGPSASVKPANLTASPTIVVTASNTITAADMASYRGKRVVFKGTPAGASAVALPLVQPTSGSFLGTAFCLLGDTWQITNANTGPRAFTFTVPTFASVIWIKEDGSGPTVITAGNTFVVGRGSVAEIVVVDDTSEATVFTLTGTSIS